MEAEKTERVLSCIQPTGELHIGNYFGAVKNWVELQDRYECFYGVVDLHAMTMPYNVGELKDNTLQMAIDLLACGIDPEKSILFIQSLVPQHTELAWIFNCITAYGELARMTQFKDKSLQIEAGKKSVKGNCVSAGLFTYPVLQAADILIYRAKYVPVGRDQEQHLELSRAIAERFNRQFGEYFVPPQPLFTEIPKLMSIFDPTKKMSKSLGAKHYIGLFEGIDSISKKLRAAPTDTGETWTEGIMSPGVENLFNLLKAATADSTIYTALLKDYNSGSLKYSRLKDATTDALAALTARFISRRNDLLKDKQGLEKQLQLMSAKAREAAGKTLYYVRELVGLPQIHS